MASARNRDGAEARFTVVAGGVDVLDDLATDRVLTIVEGQHGGSSPP